MPKRVARNALLATASLLLAGSATARDQIRVVGSSTVHPFATAVAEELGGSSDFKIPIIESTGTDGGLKLFCAGVGLRHPDIANASRRIKASEVDLCAKNGVRDITEIKIGYDGIVVANAKKAPTVNLTLRQIFLALAKEVPTPSGELTPNPNRSWKDVDDSLPEVEIEVLGPRPSSGTREAFNELALEGGCKTFSEIAALKKSDLDKYKQVCHSVREDGAYVEAGENDDLVVQKLVVNPNAFGVFGFGLLDQNSGSIQGNPLGGVVPNFESIASGSYPVSRSLYFYVKNSHIDKIPGMQEYVLEFTSEKAVGDFGYLTDKGLIPSPMSERTQYRDAAKERTKLVLEPSE